MSRANDSAHVEGPWNELYLWWLGQAATPLFIGELRFTPAMRGVSLQYDARWLKHGFALSEELPLLDQAFIPAQKDSAVGALDDARPDCWGERVIRLLDRPARLSLMEYLFLAGDERFGALGVSASRDVYRPRLFGPLPCLEDVDAWHDVLPTGQALGYQQMRVGSDGAVSSVENALSEAHLFTLNPREAREEVRLVVSVVNGWRPQFAGCGVSNADIDLLAMQIDRSEWLSQRRAAL